MYFLECEQFINGNKESCQGKPLQKNWKLCQGTSILARMNMNIYFLRLMVHVTIHTERKSK